MIYGYARVSSKGQSLYGTSLDEQEEVLRANGAEVVYKDVFTGTSADRPELNKLLGVLKGGDTLIVCKMDRLGRNAESIIHLIKELVSKDITVNILNMGIANNTIVGRLMITILSGFAEFEHDMIVERLHEGKEAKRKSDPNFKEGRKAKIFDYELFKYLDEKVDAGEVSVAEAARRLGITRAKWYRIKKQNSLPLSKSTNCSVTQHTQEC